MSGVKVTNEKRPDPVTDADSVDGVDDGSDGFTWDPPTGGTSTLDQWKQPVRVATTAPITISTGLNAGDTIDGVTLAAGDRVLVKDQSSALQNGIYVAGPSPKRAFDLDDDDEVLGAVVYVIAGTANAGTTWAVTNTAATDVGTDAINWASIGAGSITRDWELWNEGGDSLVKAHGSTGSTETIDPTDGNVHTLTLNAACTITLAAPSGTSATLEFWVTQDGTGGWGITWAGSVTEIGAPTTTASLTNIAIATTVDGGTSWVVAWVGASASDAADITFDPTGLTYAVGTDVQTAIEQLDAEEVILAAAVAGASASLTPLVNNAHVHVMDVLFSGDGSTTAWTLPVAPVDQYSVAAYVSGVLTEVTLSGTLWDTATFGSAPASATNNIRFDIVAAVT